MIRRSEGLFGKVKLMFVSMELDRFLFPRSSACPFPKVRSPTYLCTLTLLPSLRAARGFSEHTQGLFSKVERCISFTGRPSGLLKRSRSPGWRRRRPGEGVVPARRSGRPSRPARQAAPCWVRRVPPRCRVCCTWRGGHLGRGSRAKLIDSRVCLLGFASRYGGGAGPGRRGGLAFSTPGVTSLRGSIQKKTGRGKMLCTNLSTS